jgi:RNA polymerase sigma factor (sigma-70 family)
MDGADQDLLRMYVERRDEGAFAELVRRHAGMVYGAALRQTRDPHQAQEVTQAVFLLLVRKAPGMDGAVVLGAWLFRAAHYAANDLRKMQRRRAARETPMETMPDLPEETSDTAAPAAWQPYLPYLDQCLSRLSDPDRQVIWLRFFEEKSLAEVGRVLGVAEEAARKRVRRALDRLQVLLEREGTQMEGAELEAMLGTRLAAGVPAGLVAATVAVALGKTPDATSQAVASGVLRTWTWLAIKPWVLVVSAVVAVTAGVQAVRSPTLVEPRQTAVLRDDYSVAGFPRPEPVRELVRGLQAAIVRGDAVAAAGWIRFPLRVNAPEGAFVVETAEDLVRQWNRVFPHAVTSLILKSPGTRLYCDARGVMVGTGQLWVTPVGAPDGQVEARITVVNTYPR